MLLLVYQPYNCPQKNASCCPNQAWACCVCVCERTWMCVYGMQDIREELRAANSHQAHHCLRLCQSPSHLGEGDRKKQWPPSSARLRQHNPYPVCLRCAGLPGRNRNQRSKTGALYCSHPKIGWTHGGKEKAMPVNLLEQWCPDYVGMWKLCW